jgi:hypothetical protein
MNARRAFWFVKSSFSRLGATLNQPSHGPATQRIGCGAVPTQEKGPAGVCQRSLLASIAAPISNSSWSSFRCRPCRRYASPTWSDIHQARQEHRRPDAQLWLAAPGQGYHRFPGRTRPAARCARRRRSQRAGHKGSFAARPGSPSVAPPLHMLPAPTRATADNPIRCRESIALSIDLAAWAANSAPASA